MDYEIIGTVAQIVTGLATLALAFFLLNQLRLQRKESTTNLRLTIGTQVNDLFSSVYADRDFANVFLLGTEGEGQLDKIDQHRFNMFMLQYFAQFRDHWENGDDHSNVAARVQAIFGVGSGVSQFWQEIGRNLHSDEFVSFIEQSANQSTE